MTLANPWMLLGALAAIIPILLHITARRRYRTVSWAATELLQRAVARQAPRLRRADRILLAARVLILIVAPLTLARPMLTSPALPAGASSPSSAVVIIVDASGSMQSGLDAARSRAAELLATLPTNVPIGLMAMTDDAVPLTQGLITDRQRLAAAIDRLRSSWSGTQLQPSLALAIRWLDEVQAARKRIFLITDGRENVFTRDAPATQVLLRRLAIDMELTILPIALRNGTNSAITRLEIVRSASPSGAPAAIRVHLARDPEHESGPLAVELWMDGRKADRRVVDAGQTAADVLFRPIASDVGLHTLEARLDPDACECDNRRFAAFFVPERMDVALVTAPDRSGSQSAPTYLRAAFQSLADVGPPWLVRDMTQPAQIADLLDDKLWLLVLADSGPLPADAVRRIGRFLEQGGACWVTAGQTLDETLSSFQRDDSPAASWMTILRPGAAPSRLTESVRPRRIEPGTTGGQDTNAPIDLTTDAVKAAFSAVNLFQVRHVEPATDSPWSAALRTSDNWPLLLTHANHRLALLATSVDSTTTDWPYRPAFITLVDDLAWWLCKPRLVSPDTIIGSRWQAFAPARISNLTMIPPEGQPLAPDKASSMILSRPGVYQFSDGEAMRTHDARWAVAVNAPADECRSPVWSVSQVAEWLPVGPFQVISPDTRLELEVTEQDRGKEIWPFLAALLLGLLAVETALGHRFAVASEPAGPSEVKA